MRSKPFRLPGSGAEVVLREPTIRDVEEVGLDDALGFQRRLVVTINGAKPAEDWQPSRKDAGVLDRIIVDHLLAGDATIEALARTAVVDTGSEVRIPVASTVDIDSDGRHQGFRQWFVVRHPTALESNTAHAKAAEQFGADRSMLAGEIRLMRMCAKSIEDTGDPPTTRIVGYTDLLSWPFTVPDTLLMIAIYRDATTASDEEAAAAGNGFALADDGG